MQSGTDRFDPRSVEEASRRFWAPRSLPPPGGGVGPANGPKVHLLFGALSREESPLGLLQRAVLADAEARYLAQVGRRTSGHLLVRAAPTSPDLTRCAEFIE